MVLRKDIDLSKLTLNILISTWWW